MKVKLYIYSLEEFLEIIKKCRGPINIIYDNGEKKDLRSADYINADLNNIQKSEKRILRVNLEILDTDDYLKLVSFAVADY